VQRLKEMLSKVSASCLAGKCQEEASRATSEYTSKLLEEKNEVVKHLQKSHEMKYSQLQEIHDLVAESKVYLALIPRHSDLGLNLTFLSFLNRLSWTEFMLRSAEN